MKSFPLRLSMTREIVRAREQTRLAAVKASDQAQLSGTARATAILYLDNFRILSSGENFVAYGLKSAVSMVIQGAEGEDLLQRSVRTRLQIPPRLAASNDKAIHEIQLLQIRFPEIDRGQTRSVQMKPSSLYSERGFPTKFNGSAISKEVQHVHDIDEPCILVNTWRSQASMAAASHQVGKHDGEPHEAYRFVIRIFAG